MYARCYRGTHDENDTECEVEGKGGPTMDTKPSRMDAVNAVFYEYRLVSQFSLMGSG